MTVQDTIKNLREKHGLSQDQLAIQKPLCLSFLHSFLALRQIFFFLTLDSQV